MGIFPKNPRSGRQETARDSDGEKRTERRAFVAPQTRERKAMPCGATLFPASLSQGVFHGWERLFHDVEYTFRDVEYTFHVTKRNKGAGDVVLLRA